MQAQLHLKKVAEKVYDTTSIANEISLASTVLHHKLDAVHIQSSDAISNIPSEVVPIVRPALEDFKHSVGDTIESGKKLKETADRMSNEWFDLGAQVNKLQSNRDDPAHDITTTSCITKVKEIQSLSSQTSQCSSIFLERLNELINATVALTTRLDEEARKLKFESRTKKFVSFIGGLIQVIPAIVKIIASCKEGGPTMSMFSEIPSLAQYVKEYVEASQLDSQYEKLKRIKDDLNEHKKRLLSIRNQVVGLRNCLTHGQQVTEVVAQILAEIEQAANGADKLAAVRQIHSLMEQMTRENEAFERIKEEMVQGLGNPSPEQPNDGGSWCSIL